MSVSGKIRPILHRRVNFASDTDAHAHTLHRDMTLLKTPSKESLLTVLSFLKYPVHSINF